MKAILISFILIFTNFVLAQCPTGSVTLTSQADIDQFGIDYPNCEELNGSLYIENSDATDLTALSNLKTIRGFVFVRNNPSLKSLYGLQNISYIYGGLTISRNDSLVNLKGLEGQFHISGDLKIINNKNLETLEGIESLRKTNWLTIEKNPKINNIQALNNISSINSLSIIENELLSELSKLYNLNKSTRNDISQIFIYDNNNLLSLMGLDSIKSFFRIDIINNDRLKSLNGLQNIAMDTSGGVWLEISENDSLLTFAGLESIDSIKGYYDKGHLWIKNNKQLYDLNGLHNLRYIERDLEISGNPSLTDLSALSNLDYVGRDLIIDNNDSLSTLDGIDNILFDEDNHIEIKDNLRLSYCSVRSICDAINDEVDLNIENNLDGCNDMEEVDELCMSSATEYEENNTVLVHPNPVSNRIVISFNGEAMVKFFDATGKCLTILNMKDYAEIDLSTYTNGIYYVQTISGKESYITKIIKD